MNDRGLNIGIICFSRQGRNTAQRIAQYLTGKNDGSNITLCCKSRFITESTKQSLRDWTAARFGDSDAIIFVSSCGIAVRAIAPFVADKKTDPAVIVADERGLNCISLLSGHLGGANELTLELGEAIGAHPVVTTATDVNMKLAPDMLAKINDCEIDDIEKSKIVAAAILNEHSVWIYNGSEIVSVIGEEIVPVDGERIETENGLEEYSIYVSPFVNDKSSGATTMWLIPRRVYVGIGCRRGTGQEAIADAVYEAVNEAGIDKRSIRSFASVSLKADEQGLLEFCRNNRFKIRFFDAGELESLDGDFTGSAFVKDVTGTDNVCERSAMAAACNDPYYAEDDPEPYFCLRKHVKNGVTVAIAVRERRMRYE